MVKATVIGFNLITDEKRGGIQYNVYDVEVCIYCPIGFIRVLTFLDDRSGSA
jgi:hypothetical protein